MIFFSTLLHSLTYKPAAERLFAALTEQGWTIACWTVPMTFG